MVFGWGSRRHNRPVRVWRVHGGVGEPFVCHRIDGGCDGPADGDGCEGGACDHRGGSNRRYVRTELACGRNRANRSSTQWVTLRSPGLRRLLGRLLRSGRRHRHNTRHTNRSRPHPCRADVARLGRRGRTRHARRSCWRASAQHQRRSCHLDPAARRGASPRRERAADLAIPRPAAPWRPTNGATNFAAGPSHHVPGPPDDLGQPHAARPAAARVPPGQSRP